MSYNDEYLRDDNLNINWYPGHMKKTRELVQNNLKLVDVVIELLDARIPLSSKNPDIDRLVGDKPRIVLLNKADMCEKSAIDAWVAYFAKEGVKAIPINAMTGTGVNKVISECKAVTRSMMEGLAEKGRRERAIRIMIVGVPNVGKSSINYLVEGQLRLAIGLVLPRASSGLKSGVTWSF